MASIFARKQAMRRFISSLISAMHVKIVLAAADIEIIITSRAGIIDARPSAR